MNTNEHYGYQVVGTNQTIRSGNMTIAGFLAQTSGSISLSTFNDITGAAVPVLTNLPVTAGSFLRIPLVLSRQGFTFTTSLGASGVICS